EEGEFNPSDGDVPETIFGDNSASENGHSRNSKKQMSEDPFDKDPQINFQEASSDAQYKADSPLIDAEVLNSPHVVRMKEFSTSRRKNVDDNGGSVLGVLEEVIRVGQAMGYSMKGCEKDIEAIIGNQGDDSVLK
nr:RNA-directed DNA polymerase, eukaryota, reverse transcriptase zinc-binding domain protein [Tanacetum cinerariifolium]